MRLSAAVLIVGLAGIPGAAQDRPPPARDQPPPGRGSIVLPVEAVDADGHPLAGADIAATILYLGASGVQESILATARTDGEGHARIEFDRKRPGAQARSAVVWAYRPGLALAVASRLLSGASPFPPSRLTLEPPAPRTIAVLGPDDRPVAGLRVAPAMVREVNRRFGLTLPEGWSDRFAATTDADGKVALTCLRAGMVPQSIRIAGPGVAPHTMPVDRPQGKDLVLKLGRPGRLVGIVRSASGEPMADVPVEVWVQGSGTVPSNSLNLRIVPDEVLRLGPGPLRTGAQGAFQTPAILLAGSSYRVAIRQDGFRPFLSDWVAMEGERATIPDIRLQPLRKVTGRIEDRQGRAIAGARVFAAGGGTSASTDADGRFALVGLDPGKAVVLVESPGFRLRGRVVDPLAGEDAGVFTAIRTSEDPGPAMRPLPDPIPPEESRALADRLLEPYLREAPQQPDHRARLAAIAALGAFDIVRAADLLEEGRFPDADPTYQYTRWGLAGILAGTDPASAMAMAGAIPDPRWKAEALATVARALPPSERARKRELLEPYAALRRDDLKGASGPGRARILGEIAGQWLDLGDRDRARAVLDEARAIYDSIPPATMGAPSSFLSQLARLQPEEALARLEKLPGPTGPGVLLTNDTSAEVALALAAEHPAAAERAFSLWKREGIQYQTNFAAMRIARRLARADPPRARRFAASQRGPAERALAWAYVGLGLAETKQAGADEAVDQAIREIDRLRESGPGPEMVMILGEVLLMYPTNPAAVILPVVERAAPDRLAEVFWRAAALHPRIDPEDRRQLRSSSIGFECTLLARYDREVAAALFRPMDDYLHSLAIQKGPQDEFNVPSVLAKGCIDPPAAVALAESLTPPREFSGGYRGVHSARLRLAEVLGLPPERRWKHLWASMRVQLPIGDP